MEKGKMHGLLVDDNQFQQRIFCDLLGEMGFIMSTASSGESALDMLDLGKFSFFLFDMVLPGISGLELGERIVSRLGDTCPPIILMSATPQGDDGQVKGIHHSFMILAKPFSREQFMAIAAHHGITPPIFSLKESELDEFDLFDSEKLGLMNRDCEKKRRYIQLLIDDITQCRNGIAQAVDGTDTVDMQLLSRSMHSLKGLTSHLLDKTLTNMADDIERCLEIESSTISRRVSECLVLLDELIERMTHIN